MSMTADIEAAIHTSLLQNLQFNTGTQHRRLVAPLIADVVRDFAPPIDTSDEAGRALAGTLEQEGCADLGRILSDVESAEIRDFFLSRPCFNQHTPAMSDKVPRRIGDSAEQFPYGSYRLADVVAAPYLLELANNSRMISAAANYLGCTPTLYSIHAWWSFSDAPLGSPRLTQEFHRDPDDYKFCTLFVYLTDVSVATGAHQYIRRTHRPELTAQFLQESRQEIPLEKFYGRDYGYGCDPVYEQAFGPLIATFEGPAGSALIADTSGLHRGLAMTGGRRLMFWARYGLYRNFGSRQMAETPIPRVVVGGRIPAGEPSGYINRCIIGPGS